MIFQNVVSLPLPIGQALHPILDLIKKNHRQIKKIKIKKIKHTPQILNNTQYYKTHPLCQLLRAISAFYV